MQIKKAPFRYENNFQLKQFLLFVGIVVLVFAVILSPFIPSLF